jgi:hypothetical protein
MAELAVGSGSGSVGCFGTYIDIRRADVDIVVIWECVLYVSP